MNGLDDSSLLLITAISAAIAAFAGSIAALIGWLNYRNRHKDPIIMAKIFGQHSLYNESDGEYRQVTFGQSDDSPIWLMRDIKVAGLRRHKWIATIGDAIRDKHFGDILGYHRGSDWANRIVFDPPVPSIFLLLHSEANTFPKFSVEVSLRGSPSTRRRVVVVAGT